VVLCLVGEVVRKAAMLEAGRSFNHLVQSERAADHTLVTSGIYAWSRHPSYAGWFLWSIGSQLILANPVCLLAYAAVSFSFFKERIYVEEFMLLKFFGQQYRDYQATKLASYMAPL
jgi:protein-S-isoprenylcysteine O-methyltransferase